MFKEKQAFLSLVLKYRRLGPIKIGYLQYGRENDTEVINENEFFHLVEKIHIVIKFSTRTR